MTNFDNHNMLDWLAGYHRQNTEPITAVQVEELKQQWKRDPCWDIEDTEGFEAYHDELLAFSEQHEAECEVKVWLSELKDELRDEKSKVARLEWLMSYIEKRKKKVHIADQKSSWLGKFHEEQNETDVQVDGTWWRVSASIGDIGFVIRGYRLSEQGIENMPPDIAESILNYLLERESSLRGSLSDN